MVVKKTFLKPGILLGVMILVLACGLPSGAQKPTVDLQATRVALSFQATSLKLSQMQATLQAPKPATQPPPPVAQPIAQVPVLQPTVPPPPVPQATAVPVPTQALPTQPAPTADINEKIKKANVLIYEDIWGYPGLSGDRRVSQAVSALNFSCGRVINTGDALGDFKSQLNTSTPWDIVVISAESRSQVKGEFFDYIQPLLDKKVALVFEIWYLDKINLGKIMPITQECGIALEKNWTRNENKYNKLDYSILLFDPSDPLFTTPNSGISLTNPSYLYWFGDAGDYLKLGAGGDATLLAGTTLANKSAHGLIARCMGGRVIFQTFSTHDYAVKDTVALWENYIYNALSAHFQALQQ
jgi:hypothetical protein